jgi:pimeloyl-ACP methyl ester carboxylesterase
MNNTRQTRNNTKGLAGGVLTDIFRLIIVGVLSALFFLIRYVLRTPQLLRSALPGEERLYRWTHGHIFYKVLGAQDAPPLVLIHTPELAASSYEMRGIMEPLAHHYRVYALDLPGFGLSDHPQLVYTGELYVALLQDFLSHVVGQPATLVASGLSANYAIAVASAALEQCERLVLLSPTALFADGKQQHWYTPLLSNRLIGLCIYAFLTTRVVLQAILSRGTTQGANALSSSELDTYFAAAHQFGAEHPVIAYMAGSLSLDISQQLKTLQQPVLVLWGLHAMQRTLHSTRATMALQEGTSSPLLALTNTSIGVLSNETDSAKQVVLLDDAGRHVQDAQPGVVASYIIALMTKEETPDTIHYVTPDDMVELVESDYTKKEESPMSASSLQGAMPEARSDADVLEEIEQMEVAQGVQEAEIADTPQVETVEAYCVKCKQKRMMSNPTDTVTKKGRRAKEGTCPICGTRLFRFIAGQKE